jgi:antitoxin HicB
MEYIAKFTHEDDHILVEFPDCPGCQTFGDNEEHARQMAEEALEGWLEANLIGGKVPPRPRKHHGVAIQVRPRLAIALEIRWARDDRGWTQRDLAKHAKVAQQQIARLEDPDTNPTISTIEMVAQALQRSLRVSLIEGIGAVRGKIHIKPKPGGKAAIIVRSIDEVIVPKGKAATAPKATTRKQSAPRHAVRS